MEEPLSRPSRVAPGRSCDVCRKRKIRCDRKQPCSYCTKLRVRCIYPNHSHEAKRAPDGDVLSRLKRIEATVLKLDLRTTSPESSRLPRDAHSASEEGTLANAGISVSPGPASGRLLLEEGDGRYVTSGFWVDLDKADDDRDDQENENAGPGDVTTASTGPTHATATEEAYRAGFVFGSRLMSDGVQQLHPDESRIFALWQVFLESVDPLLKLLHVPVTQRQVIRASQTRDNVPPAFEAVMFAIYFAAVTSMQCSVSCRNLLGEERQRLLERYRRGVEQSLARANCMSAPNTASLQALVLFLICARQSMDKTYIWTMTGLLVRLATKLGLHRDPVALGLSPFVSEMRRRLWWQICILDVRTAEDNDMEPMICEHSFDTKLPLNVNDTDLDVNMTQPVSESSQRTEMLFALTRFEISYAARKLVFSSKFASDNGYKSFSLAEKNDLIDSLQNRLEEKYLRYCDTQIPICFLAVTATRTILTKMKLTINHPAQSGPHRLPQERFTDLVANSIEIIEHAHTLRSNDKYSRWVWLFQKYIEWDAVAFLLHSLTAAPYPLLVDKAWDAIDGFFDSWKDQIVEGDQLRWRRLHSLRAKALAKQSPASHAPQAIQSPASSVTYPANRTRWMLRGNQTTLQSNLSTQIETSATMPVASQQTSEQMLLAPLPHLAEPTDAEGVVDWDFDSVPFVTQGMPSWEMEIDESTFNSWF